jgi:hypothetical protein
MFFRTFVATAIMAGCMVALGSPVEAAKKPKKSYTYYSSAQDPPYVRTRSSNRLVVRPRSYLSAGTETKQYEEHYADYAFPPSGSFDYSNRNGAQGTFTRRPLADPWDIPGWPKF